MSTSEGATLRAFIEAVLLAGADNAEEVVPVVLAVAGGVLAEAEPGSVALQPVDGAADLLWASFAGRRVVFRYNAMTAMIELRTDTSDGHPDRLFGRRSLQMDVVNFFGALRAERSTEG